MSFVPLLHAIDAKENPMSSQTEQSVSDLVEAAVRLLAHGSPEDWNRHYREKSFQEHFLPRAKDALLFDFDYQNRQVLYQCINGRFIQKEPIDYLEFGVWQGVSFSHWLNINTHASSRFFGFDSFEGLPEDWNRGAPKGTFSQKGAVPTIEDPRATFVKGLFQQSIPPFLDGFAVQNRLVIHFDADLYSSTLYTMMALDRFITPGTIFLFDEFTAEKYTCEYAALHDYCAACYRDYKVLCSRKDYVKLAIEIVVPE
ncbi:TylF/MycF/NovP-related O-methyltransferase [Paucidesulfovibrio gracilis]|nr:TylF/MycF/NovP-related O-methyltransferase [Paucidesulfovibrio gracilis]